MDALYGYAARGCEGPDQLAEDIIQETWLRAVREWPCFGVPDDPLAWLATVGALMFPRATRTEADASRFEGEAHCRA